MDTKEIQSKKKEKKKKKMRIKITNTLAKIFHKREIYFREHSRIRLATKYSTHMHILIYEYETSLLGSRVWLYDIRKVSILHILSLPELHISFLEVGWIEAKQCLGEELYTLSDLRESFEEQGYVLILKSFKKNPSFLNKRSADDWILIHSVPQLSKMVW